MHRRLVNRLLSPSGVDAHWQGSLKLPCVKVSRRLTTCCALANAAVCGRFGQRLVVGRSQAVSCQAVRKVAHTILVMVTVKELAAHVWLIDSPLRWPGSGFIHAWRGSDAGDSWDWLTVVRGRDVVPLLCSGMKASCCDTTQVNTRLCTHWRAPL